MKRENQVVQRKYLRSEEHKGSLEEKIESVSVRCQRAEKLAAYVEFQLKTLKPNTVLDYKLVREVEPSSQLVAALLVKEPIKDTLKANPLPDEEK